MTFSVSPRSIEPGRDLALYIHVPFCTVRCGYCDFNTYTRGFGAGADLDSYHQSVLAEIDLAARTLAPFEHRPVCSIFFGGGTPSLLDSSHLQVILDYVATRIPVAADAEITLEANPDTVDAQRFDRIAAAGVNRISMGMQSGVKHVLDTLDRTHDPDRIPSLVQAGQQASLDVSLDLIYGTPGESLEDWQCSIETALAAQPDHISTYALVIEPGTKMGRLVRKGDLPQPDPDDEAAKYEIADRMLSANGYAWYEISNWAKLEPGETRGQTDLTHASVHNLAYWKNADWWGVGPGAHSHLGTTRWWNRKHPRAWADSLAAGEPAAGSEELTAEDELLERVMLNIRTADGLALTEIPRPLRGRVQELVGDGLVDPAQVENGRAVLTLRGRLLADYVTRVLTP
ncbi:radical SAM family heme chaperone HemW [Gleimia hominis]|uniref:radical SAM family heme chaperone HemW n=1 Tax=Gleimia hominis TaxID=595468 RepID=UPI000C7F811C|nr:radical SAM family heme chaperone HemW [Gleimia hominis]WIK64895.1 radical SAM family heme chaperone HemW [Gleimia hominis]